MPGAQNETGTKGYRIRRMPRHTEDAGYGTEVPAGYDVC